jgi:hypothetical protein
MARDAAGGDIDDSARDNMLSDRSKLLYVGKNINEGLEAFKGVSRRPHDQLHGSIVCSC